MPRRAVMAMLAVSAALGAGCLYVDQDPCPSFRVSDGGDTRILYYDGDTIDTALGRALKVEIILSEDTSEHELSDIELEMDIEDEETLGVIPHWQTGVYVVYGKKEGEVTLKAAGSHVTFAVHR